MAKTVLEREREDQDACDTAEHFKNECFAKLHGVAFRVNFELFGVPVLGRLRGSPYGLKTG